MTLLLSGVLLYLMIKTIMVIIETMNINGTFTIKSNQFLVFISGIFFFIQISIFVVFILLYGRNIMFTGITSSLFFFNLDTSMLFNQMLILIRFNVQNQDNITTQVVGKQRHLNQYISGLFQTYLILVQFKEFTFPVIYFSFMIDIMYTLYITYIQIMIEIIQKYNDIHIELHYKKQVYTFHYISVLILILKINNIIYTIFPDNMIVKHILYVILIGIQILYYKYYYQLKLHFKKQQNFI